MDSFCVNDYQSSRLRHDKTLTTGKPAVGKTTLVQTIVEGNDFIRGIKQRSDIHLLEVTHANRNRLPEALLEGL